MVNIPVFPEIASGFIQKIELGGIFYSLRIRWNTRSESWFLHVFDADGNPLITGKRLVPNYPLTEIHSDRFKGELIVLDKQNDLTDAVMTYENLGKRFFLVYLSEEEANGL
ncbi:MAG: hypothetical protein B6241_12415 [Spirochaetaceae bacterium 4572_59]|nr:MAG: hypothetical protein B6241_12415 [Spirochaetaceae bacterium 4572_59]